MKLILAIMSNDDSPAVSSALTKENYQVTRHCHYRRFSQSPEHHAHRRNRR